MPTSAVDSHLAPGQTSPEPRVRSSEQLEAHASEQPEAQASDEGLDQGIFMNMKYSRMRSRQAMQMIHFLRNQTAAGKSLRVPAWGGTRILLVLLVAHYMCQRVELSESSASAMYMITPTQGMLGMNRTSDSLPRLYWWSGCRQAVQDYVRSCKACQCSKASLL